ncbi:hypothetical protein B296_00058336 [Ensete ventricosum]|uniref:Uncharacterized protein n=1 Tax=Ensete ventricosum TaxID=4639 RepID=A0A426X9P0_ENSVE|nr:hypothetical protein B296_00058336 [Ensete ventricosum]
MVSVWRADDSGGEALEVKRRCKVQLEGNNNGGKGREEGMKMRAVAVMAIGNATGSARLGVTGDNWGRKAGKKQGRKKVAAMITKERLLKSGSITQVAMLATAKGGKGDSGNDRSDNSGFWGRTMIDSFTTVLVLPTKVASDRGMGQANGEILQQGGRCNDDDDYGKGCDYDVDGDKATTGYRCPASQLCE